MSQSTEDEKKAMTKVFDDMVKMLQTSLKTYTLVSQQNAKKVQSGQTITPSDQSLQRKTALNLAKQVDFTNESFADLQTAGIQVTEDQERVLVEAGQTVAQLCVQGLMSIHGGSWVKVLDAVQTEFDRLNKNKAG